MHENIIKPTLFKHIASVLEATIYFRRILSSPDMTVDLLKYGLTSNLFSDLRSKDAFDWEIFFFYLILLILHYTVKKMSKTIIRMQHAA